MTPTRIQLSRRAGWRKPAGTVVVARPTYWGNPFKAGEATQPSWGEHGGIPVRDRAHAVDLFRQLVVAHSPAYRAEARIRLTGKDLACWCPLGEPCHAEVLLTVANPRALSVRRPWAQLLAAGVKPCENRTWSTTYRGPLLIHASQTWDPIGYQLARHLQVPVPTQPMSVTGYIASAQLVDVHDADSCSGQCAPWGQPNGYHWILADPVAFERPVSGPGRLRLFTPPPAVMAMPW